MDKSTVIVTDKDAIEKMVADTLQSFTNKVVVPLLNQTSQGNESLQTYKKVVDDGKYGSRSFLDKLRKNMSIEEEQRIFPRCSGMIFVVVPDLEDYLAGRKLKHDAMIKLDPRLRGD